MSGDVHSSATEPVTHKTAGIQQLPGHVTQLQYSSTENGNSVCDLIERILERVDSGQFYDYLWPLLFYFPLDYNILFLFLEQSRASQFRHTVLSSVKHPRVQCIIGENPTVRKNRFSVSQEPLFTVQGFSPEMHHPDRQAQTTNGWKVKIYQSSNTKPQWRLEPAYPPTLT